MNETQDGHTDAGQGMTSPPQDFWERNGRMIVRLMFVAIVLVGAYLYSSSEPRPDSDTSPSSDQTTGGLSVTDSKIGNAELKVTPPVKNAEVSAKVKMESGKVTVQAVKGEGRTHLARRALNEYLKARGSQGLQAEHKIYIEDYLQKHSGAMARVFTGSEMQFSESDIQHAIDLSFTLSPGQIKNLQRYAAAVPQI